MICCNQYEFAKDRQSEKDPLNLWNVNYMSIMQSCYCAGLWTWRNMGWGDPTQKMYHLHFFVCGHPNVWTTIIGTFAKLLHLVMGMGWKKTIDNVDI
jgi:hypothetical protein